MHNYASLASPRNPSVQLHDLLELSTRHLAKKKAITTTLPVFVPISEMPDHVPAGRAASFSIPVTTTYLD